MRLIALRESGSSTRASRRTVDVCRGNSAGRRRTRDDVGGRRLADWRGSSCAPRRRIAASCVSDRRDLAAARRRSAGRRRSRGGGSELRLPQRRGDRRRERRADLQADRQGHLHSRSTAEAKLRRTWSARRCTASGRRTSIPTAISISSLARRDGPPVVLRNNGDNTFAVQTPFNAVSRLRGFAWVDLDGEGVPDAALLDDLGVLRVFLNLRGARSSASGPCRPRSARCRHRCCRRHRRRDPRRDWRRARRYGRAPLARRQRRRASKPRRSPASTLHPA